MIGKGRRVKKAKGFGFYDTTPVNDKPKTVLKKTFRYEYGLFC